MKIKINDKYILHDCDSESTINKETNEVTVDSIVGTLVFEYNNTIYSSNVSKVTEVNCTNSDIISEVIKDKYYISNIEVDIDLYNRAISNPGLLPELSYTDNGSKASYSEDGDMDDFMDILGIHQINTDKKTYGGIKSNEYSYNEGESYRITLHMSSKPANSEFLRDEATVTKLITFTIKADLSKYIVSNYILNDWNYNLMFEDYPEFKEKLFNANLQLIKESVALYSPIILEDIELIDNWIEYGYLEVDEDTSFHGNYKVDGKECCKVSIILSEYSRRCYPLETIKHDLNEIDDTKSFKEQEIDALKIVSTFKRSLIEDKPFQVHLSGNDDDSWSCGFWTLEQAIMEVSYLKSIQPINKARHVIGRAYYFSN